MDQLHRNAEQIAEQATLDLGRLLPCEPRPDNLMAYRDLLVSRLVGGAYRRPLTAVEHGRYVEFFEATSEGDFTTGAKWVMVATLQSPEDRARQVRRSMYTPAGQTGVALVHRVARARPSAQRAQALARRPRLHR